MNVEDIKRLRQLTGAGIADCKEALSLSKGDMNKAKDILKKKGLDKASQKSDREVKTGLVEVYSHGGKVGVLVEVLCETDFVAKTEEFKFLAHELSLQVASMNPSSVEELLKQEYIRDNSMIIDQLIKSVVGKLGENIQVGRFERIALGE
ncbi:translation elongation factor Ts [Candidatus Daviesbacteria bacterium RIFCSPLOWO2_01_FULL_38_10]|uniref:Elongation factor Ts n=1 Tax=Candidatus Daviesbacteria bacterium GW2011_GWF2_38_6 TaxID=1618432 RepID=A0A0G0KEB2_9BACT|nr:MAG: Elongation factor Ts [Candidatus Daviesbacteria bacterium GW2011_GWA2_38_17]KKQ77142.1 MAG: Elongation factor Ts [Candidatus Daviesbacteria bacterium GW2011_GWF2_38_6]OGE26054.1 MAG: translation elongation factor Ts [Candidatus Daviesbacteria bacterium RIFCSPHIGHO2_02_FULL_39_41]OGE38314.1 MAG: translation elongation factor Ts [Candidatus Daviesbacteria bacterium RIFCSPLOWO2_01_FULL_38_10]OGE44867.1 MAG: translation elongation factor Ts [Candidatus Daviesbacteria bacterium RIFCSPHIGHO2_